VKFETYASLRIRGAIIDNIRKLDWAPRSLRQDSKKLEQVYAELESRLGRDPKDAELAETMGVTVDDVREMIKKSQISSFISLDDFVEQNHEHSAVLSQKNENEPETELMRGEVNNMLAAAIEKLTEKERMVVTLYYYEELTLKEISKVMNVTESRISQIHSKAIFKLKTRLGRYVSEIDW
jgi:RNA polymerase sigma factor for flagellar operon FliA